MPAASVAIPAPPPDRTLFIVGLAVAAFVALAAIRRWRLCRLRKSPRRFEPLPPRGALLAAIGLLVIGQIGFVLASRVFGLEPGPDLDLRGQALLGIGMYSLQLLGAASWLTVANAARRRRWSGPRERLPGPVTAGVIGLVGLVLAWPVVSLASIAASMIIERLGGPEARTIAHETLRQLVDGSGDAAWAFVVVVQSALAAPIVEEVLYRGCLQGALVRLLGRWPAIILVSAIFALMHYGAADPGALFALFTLSLGFGIVYERSGRLAAPIAMHVGFNGVNLLLAMAI